MDLGCLRLTLVCAPVMVHDRITERSLALLDRHPVRATLHIKRRSPYTERGVRPWNIFWS